LTVVLDDLLSFDPVETAAGHSIDLVHDIAPVDPFADWGGNFAPHLCAFPMLYAAIIFFNF